jgi:ABC-type transporter MlaC component
VIKIEQAVLNTPNIQNYKERLHTLSKPNETDITKNKQKKTYKRTKIRTYIGQSLETKRTGSNILTKYG